MEAKGDYENIDWLCWRALTNFDTEHKNKFSTRKNPPRHINFNSSDHYHFFFRAIKVQRGMETDRALIIVTFTALDLHKLNTLLIRESCWLFLFKRRPRRRHKGTVDGAIAIVQQPFLLFIYDENEKSEHLQRTFDETKGKNIYWLRGFIASLRNFRMIGVNVQYFIVFGLMKVYDSIWIFCWQSMWARYLLADSTPRLRWSCCSRSIRDFSSRSPPTFLPFISMFTNRRVTQLNDSLFTHFSNKKHLRNQYSPTPRCSRLVPAFLGPVGGFNNSFSFCNFLFFLSFRTGLLNLIPPRSFVNSPPKRHPDCRWGERERRN